MKQDITLLFNQIHEISKKYYEISKKSGDNFNIFQVINLTSNEVRLHSKFIAELLKPKGSHGQGDIFLSLFVSVFEIKFNPVNTTVTVEKYIGKKTETEGGRIDIFIENSNKNSIIIENKIYAKDQDNQLVRYFNFRKDNIFYLSLYGDAPTKESYGNLEIDKDFKVISYNNDIIFWLEKCRKEAVQLPLLREGITHYINLIKYLTGQSNNKSMENEIRDFITLTPQNIKAAITVNKNIKNAKIKLQWLFWKNLREKFTERNIPLYGDENKKTVKWQNVNNFYKSRNRDVCYGLLSKVYDKNDITVHYGIEIGDCIYYGFAIKENGKGEISDKPKYESIRKFLKEINQDYIFNKWWLGWKYTSPKLNFRDFNSEAIFNLANRDILNKQVEEIVENSIKDIELMKVQLNKFPLDI